MTISFTEEQLGKILDKKIKAGFEKLNENIIESLYSHTDEITEVGIHQAGFSKQTQTTTFKAKKIPRSILPSSKRMKNNSSYASNQTSLHWGQRKLLLSEIDFLTDFSKKGDLVIYAGAAPGLHITMLTKLFPDIEFILVDPAKICISATRPGIKEIIQDFFTDEMAVKLSKFYKKTHRVLFISDIRRKAVGKMIVEDMLNQQRWVEIIKPAASLLKFRLPWENEVPEHSNSLRYLHGEQRLQVWAKNEAAMLGVRSCPK